MEIILVIGIIGIIAASVIVAINPTAQLTDAADSKRRSVRNEMKNAFIQYLIDNGDFPGDKAIPSGSSNALPICRFNITDASCVNVDAILPTYLTCIPYDGAESDANLTGYTAYQQNGRITIVSTYIDTENSNSSGECEN